MSRGLNLLLNATTKVICQQLASFTVALNIDDDERRLCSPATGHAPATTRDATATAWNANATARLWSGLGLTYAPRNALTEVSEVGCDAEEEVWRETKGRIRRYGETGLAPRARP